MFGQNSMTAHQSPAGSNNAARNRRPILWTVFGTLLGVVLLYAATRKVDAATLVATLKSANLWWGLAFIVIVVGFTALKAWRWQLLLRPIVEVKFNRLHSAIYIGLAVNFLVAHVGEFLRTAMVARNNQAAVSAVLATVVVERALDFVAFLAVIACLSLTASNLPDYVGTAVVITGGVVVLAVIALYTFLHPPQWLLRLIITLSRPIPEALKSWSLHQIERFQIGLVAIRDMRMMLTVIAISVLQWSLIVGAIWCSAAAVGESATIVALVATFVLILLALMLPNSPLQIGTAQLAFTIGLGTGGIMATTAVAASLIYTMFLIMPVMMIGGICLLNNRQ